MYEHACFLSFSRSKLFPKSSPNPNESTHERSESTRMLIHESQRFRNKADGLVILNDTPVQFSFYYFPVSDLTSTKQLKASYLKTGVKKIVEAAKQ